MTRNRSLVSLILIAASLGCLATFVIFGVSLLRIGRTAEIGTGVSSAPALVFPIEPSRTNLLSSPSLTPAIPQQVEPPTLQANPTPGQPTNPPGLSGKIVFTCQIFRDSRYNQICMMNADGNKTQRLTTEDEFDHIYPSLAPDGLSLVFSSNLTGGYEIYSLDWLGNQVQLSSEELEGSYGAFAPEISPDGQSIVYARIASDQDRSIWIMDRSGNQARWLFGSQDVGAWDPSWSPDGTRILFMSDRTGSDQLHTIAVDGGEIQQITNVEGLRGRNDWSPDGKTIATYVGNPWEREILLMDADGSNSRYLTDGGNNLAPSFSPDGQWVAITSYKDNYRENNGCEIYVVRVDGSDLRRLTDNDFCDWQPRWGP